MTAKDVIKVVCVFLQKEEFLELEELDGTGEATEAQTKELEHMLRCLNLVINEIATDYIPLLFEETLIPTGGHVLFNSLTKNPIDIIRVEDRFGIRVNHKLFPDYLETIDGEVKILYSYEPEQITALSQALENFSQKVGERVIAYGVAMEYCFICGLHDDASIWEKRFKDALLIAARKKSEIKLPKRRWK